MSSREDLTGNVSMRPPSRHYGVGVPIKHGGRKKKKSAGAVFKKRQVVRRHHST